jgi:hypothetical protein
MVLFDEITRMDHLLHRLLATTTVTIADHGAEFLRLILLMDWLH